MLIDLEIEHHLQALARSAEVIHVHTREYVCFGENDGVAFAPGEKLAEDAKHVVLLGGAPIIGAFSGNDEGHSVHAKPRDSPTEARSPLFLKFRPGPRDSKYSDRSENR